MDVDFSVWRHYFDNNSQHLRPIDWEDDYSLSPAERETIVTSIQQFQIGENSEGKHLIRNAQQYVERTKDYDYYEAVAAFIREEQRHARDLARFMERQRIPLIRKHWVDQVFRKLRRFAGLELSVIVLITAEIIAKVYYKALKAATNSRTLIDLCDQILQDEQKHVEFQSMTLYKVAARRSRVMNAFSGWLHRFLLEGTLLVVWQQHKRVLIAGGYNYQTFCFACREEFRESDALIRSWKPG